MGVLYETYQNLKSKKVCTMCGCIMEPNSKNDLCECCLDELADIDEEVED